MTRTLETLAAIANLLDLPHDQRKDFLIDTGKPTDLLRAIVSNDAMEALFVVKAWAGDPETEKAAVTLFNGIRDALDADGVDHKIEEKIDISIFKPDPNPKIFAEIITKANQTRARQRPGR